MLAHDNLAPLCFGRSFFVPGEGACNAGCRLADRCRAAYLGHARAALASHPSELSEDERLFVIGTGGAPATGQVPAARPAPVLELCAPTAACTTDPATRKVSRPWTDARRRPLASFRPASVSALAVEVLRAAGRPLHVREVAALVQRDAATRGVRLAGRTPHASVGLALRQVQGVQQVGRGLYVWAG